MQRPSEECRRILRSGTENGYSLPPAVKSFRCGLRSPPSVVRRLGDWTWACLLCLGPALVSGAEGDRDRDLPQVTFRKQAGEVGILVAGQPAARYVYRDEEIPRPYLAHVRAPCGIQVTRTHPPGKGDPSDHARLHPGIWLAFGDISGQDFWRLEAKVVHDGFEKKPEGGPGRGSFTVRNRYLAADEDRVVCREVCTYTFLVRPSGYLIIHDSTFSSESGDFTFGDQEEMGLGVRLATPLTVRQKKGGRILDSRGRLNEKGVWGKQAEWCDYSGTIDGVPVGVSLFPDPRNFRPSWYHARDYGFVAANPFGRNAMTDGEKSRITVRKGEELRLRFGIFIHGNRKGGKYDPQKAYRDYLRVCGAASTVER